MVLQEPVNQPNSREFVLRKSKVHEFKSLEERVRHLFGAEFEVFIPIKDLNNDERNGLDDCEIEWIRVISESHPELLDKAKEYIISVCNPQIRCRVDFAVADLLEDKGTLNIVDEVERNTSAYLAVDSEGFLEICGANMAVALATSRLDEFLHNAEQVKTDYNENQIKNEDVSDVKEKKLEDDEPEVIWKRREIAPKVVKHPKRETQLEATKDCERTIIQDENNDTKTTENSSNMDRQVNDCVKDEISSSSSEELSCTSAETASSSLNSMTATEENSQGHMASSSNVVKPRDFALKLGYTESAVSSALSKLGPGADKNLLLMELVKAQNSAKQIEEGSSLIERPSSTPPISSSDPNTLRPIVIDGSNIAMSHGNQKVFSCRGIGIAVDWFMQRGHRDIKVFVPSWRKETSKPESPIVDQQVLKRLEEDQILVWTPSRCINNRRVVCYDDRFIIRLAHQTDGVIVSNDNFRDLQNESLEWRKVIEQRLLMYSFVDDRFMPPDDPAGRHGPTLDEFLKKGCGKPCPYGRRCTYGNRCKFLHPERNSRTEAEMLALANQLSEKLMLNPPEIPYGEVQQDTLGGYGDSFTPRQSRPLPPPPDMPAYLLTKPLPPLPTELTPRHAKPLPIPQGDMYHNMMRIFPPTLRNNHASQNGQRPSSDPTPLPTPTYDVPPDQYNRASLPRRSSIPHGMSIGPSYVDGYPSLPSGNGHYSHPVYPAHTHMHQTAHPQDTVARGMMPDGYAVGYQQAYQPQHWTVSQSFQQYPPQYHFNTNGGHPHYHPYHNNSYNGQGNSYYRTRGLPRDVNDGVGGKDNDNVEQETKRIQLYEILVEVFPDDATKILKVLDENPMVTNVDELTQILLDYSDS